VGSNVILADYQRFVFPTMGCANFFHTFDEADYAPSCSQLKRRKGRQTPMLIAAATVIGTNLYDILMRVLGSEVMRAVFSYLIRQALTRVGL